MEELRIMKRIVNTALSCFIIFVIELPHLTAFAQKNVLTIPHVKPRLLVLTDLSNEPDDEESLVRLLVYADQFDIEGLIATTSTWLREKPREDLIRRGLAAYDEVRPNLLIHAEGFPSADELLGVTCTGQPGFGMEAVGAGKSTGGSQRIIEAADRADNRPLWVSVWGGANTLAQAIYDVRSSRTPAELERFIAKLRVYTISDQDDSGGHERPFLFFLPFSVERVKTFAVTIHYTLII